MISENLKMQYLISKSLRSNSKNPTKPIKKSKEKAKKLR
jgi:hypothetical protein